MARQRVDLGSPTLNQAFDELRNDYSISKPCDVEVSRWALESWLKE
jgi:hypothetical protein